MLKLRPTTIDDIDGIMKWVNDSHVREVFADFKEKTKDEEEQFLTELLKSKTDRTYTVEDDGEYIGQVSINKIYWPAKNGRLAIAIVPEKRIKGYGKAALDLLLDKAFNELKLHKVWVMLRPKNHARDYYNSIGFTEEAKLVEEYINPKSGEYIDMIRMYLLEGQYKQNTQAK